VRVVNWSPDSKRIISGALDNAIRIFDVETGTLLCEPLTGHKNNLTALSLRPPLQGDEPEVVSGALRLFSFAHQDTYLPPLSQSRRNGPGLGSKDDRLCQDSYIFRVSQRLGPFCIPQLRR
jgi:WD40 repeat protein